MRSRGLWALPARPVFRLPRRTGVLRGRARRHVHGGGSLMLAVPASRATTPPLSRFVVAKFASCDGCQLTLLDLQDDLLAIADRLDSVEFAEATSNKSSGPLDILLLGGSL